MPVNILKYKFIDFVHKSFCFSRFYLLVIVCPCFLFQTSLAQTKTIDSLKKVLPALRDKQRINCLNALSSAYVNKYADTALLYETEAFKEAQNLNYLQGMGDAMVNKGRLEENLWMREQNYFKAISFYEKCNNTDTLAKVYFTLGWTLNEEANFNKSLDVYKKAAELFQKTKDSVYWGITLTFLGLVSGNSGDFTNAFEYGYQALEIRKKNNEYDRDGIMWALGNLGRLFQEVEDYPTAIDYYEQTFDYSKENNIPWDNFKDKIAECYWQMHENDSALYFITKYLLLFYRDTIVLKKRLEEPQQRDFETDQIEVIEGAGLAHLLKNEYDEALKNYLSTMKERESIHCTLEVMILLSYTTKTYIQKGDYKNALTYAKKLLLIAKNTGAQQYIRDGTKQLWQIYNHEKSVDSAYKYYQQYSVIKDSVDSYRFLTQLTSFKQAAATEKKELQYQQQLRKEELMRNIIIAVLIFILIVASLIIANIKLKRRKEHLQQLMTEANTQLENRKKEQHLVELQQQKTELEMQALRAQMNPHFIFNCLNSINRFIIKNEAAKAADYLTKFAKLIRIILQQSGKPYVPLEDELHCLQLYMDLEALRFEIPFQHEIDCDGIDIATVSIPSLLIQPFVENAIWHGLHAKENGYGKIFINMKIDNDILYCKIYDNGIGVNKSTALKQTIENGRKSLGIKLTQERLQLITTFKQQESKITMYDLEDEPGEGTGTCVTLEIPVKEI